MNAEILGKRIRDVRNELKLTMKDLAEKLDTNIPMIQRLEAGKEISNEMLITALTFFSNYVSLDKLFTEDFNLIKVEQEAEKQPDSEIYNIRYRKLFDKQLETIQKLEEILKESKEQLKTQRDSITK